MKKYFKSLIFAILAMIVAVSFTACGDDKEKDEPTVNNSIIGNWYDSEDIITFRPNGTYTYYERVKLSQKTYDDIWDGVYDYNEATGVITIYYGGEIDYYIKVASIVENTLVGYFYEAGDKEYETYTMRRIDDKDMPFIHLGE